jgi:hypothetical protein
METAPQNRSSKFEFRSPRNMGVRRTILAALLLCGSTHGERPKLRLARDRVALEPFVPAASVHPSTATSMTVRAAAWLGCVVASGSQALLVFAALPVAMAPQLRRAIAAVLTLFSLLSIDALAAWMASRPTRAPSRRRRLERVPAALAEAAQALAICAAGWSVASALSNVRASRSDCERAALVGGALCAAALRALREPLPVHLVLPFAGCLAHSFAHILRLMRSTWSAEASVSYLSACAFVSGITTASAVAALTRQRKRTDGGTLVGLGAVADLAITSQLIWTTLCLATWAFAPAPAFGFALIAAATTVSEFAFNAHVRELPAADPARASWVAMSDTLHSLSLVNVALASWRAFWLPETSAAQQASNAAQSASQFERYFFWAAAQPLGAGPARSRLERHFVSLIFTFACSAGSGAARADATLAIGSIGAVVLIVGRTVVESLFYESPLVLAGGIGLLIGVALLGALVVFYRDD